MGLYMHMEARGLCLLQLLSIKNKCCWAVVCNREDDYRDRQLIKMQRMRDSGDGHQLIRSGSRLFCPTPADTPALYALHLSLHILEEVVERQ